MCLTCPCKCAESKTIGSLHILMHTSVIGLTAQLHQHIRESDHCTFTFTHQVLVNVQWPEYLTCACKCAVSQTLGSMHISMHISVTRLTPHIHEHIGQSDQCTFTYTHQVHEWPVWLTCSCKRAKFAHYTLSCTYRTWGPLPNYKNTSDSRITARLQAHIRSM